MYTLVIEAKENSVSIQDFLKGHSVAGADLVVLDRESVAAQLLRSDAPPRLVVRTSAKDLEGSPILTLARDGGCELPPTVVVCDASEEAALRDLGEPALIPLRRPLEPDALYKILDKLWTRSDGEIAIAFGEGEGPELHFGRFIGESSAMQTVYRTLERVARTESTCLITGESGTGKELAAEVVHNLSPRSGEAFVPVNAGAIPENLLESEFFGHKRGAFTGAVSDHKGRFETADKGTLFLDEIGEMQLGLQVKLLRALQTGDIQPVGSTRTKRVDVRVVAATNRDLEVEVGSGNFREDLFYRLAIIPIQMPALRNRAEDIPMLVRFLVDKINQRTDFPSKGITSGALSALSAYDWPGNIRELRATLERMVVMAELETLTVEDLPYKIRSAVGLEEEPQAEGDVPGPTLPEEGLELSTAVDRFETHLILQALDRTGWNKNQAARLLSMNRTTLVEKLKKKKLSAPEKAAPSGKGS